jgi:flagellin-like hook-associated protein FlgL
MATNITLSAGVRQNLLALQNTASLLGTTQNRLATGKKVNSALDNPTNFFTSSSLSARASDLSSILDAMSNGINTLKAADNGLSAIKTAVETMKATVSQARQDSSFKSTSYTIDGSTIGTSAVKNLAISGGAVTGTVNIALNTATAAATSATLTGTGGFSSSSTIGGSPAAITIQAAGLNGGTAVNIGTLAAADTVANAVTKINAALDGATGGDGGITATAVSGQLVLTGTSGNNITLSGDSTTLTAVGFATGNRVSTDGVAGVTGAVKTVDALVTAINSDSALTGKVKASNDGGKLAIQNLSTDDLTLTGATASAVDGGSGAQTVGGNTVRKNLITQFNDLRTQLDKLAEDASFNGVNLLRGDTLKLVFNETNTSSISIVSQNAIGINSTVLGIGAASASEFSSNTALDVRVDALATALTSLRSQASAFGSNLSIVQNRTEFTKAMINTLQTGSDALVLADSNEEAANLLALQTRQQLSTTALSLASQADQAVLRLF